MRERVDLHALLGVLLARPDAIARVASCRQAPVLGAIFVLSAGFARNWDRPGWTSNALSDLGGPFGISFATSSVIWLLFYSTVRAGGFLRGYVAFLGLYWLTAPLAWLLDAAVFATVGAFFLGIVCFFAWLLKVVEPSGQATPEPDPIVTVAPSLWWTAIGSALLWAGLALL